MESNDAPVSSQIFIVNGHLQEMVKHAPGWGEQHVGRERAAAAGLPLGCSGGIAGL
jgi:hypothetical protein